MDEQLYSRQLYVLGREAQERLQKCKVLVTGSLNGVGVEIAKNLMLAGVNALTISDEAPCVVSDLGTNFFVSEKDVKEGKKRDQVVIEHLGQLNGHVTLDSRKKEDLVLEDGKGYGEYNVVVLVNSTKPEIERIGEFCHSRDIAFISTGSYGLYGYIFCDFGKSFTVVDVDGEAPKQGIVVNIEKEDSDDGKNQLVISTADDKHHGLKDGDWVAFSGIKGLDSLNDGEPRELKLKAVHNSDGKLVDGLAFTIDVPDGETGSYIGGGNFEQVKKPSKLEFQDVSSSMKNPECVINDWNDFDMPKKLHSFLQGIFSFQKQFNRLAQPGSLEDAKKIVELTKEEMGKLNETCRVSIDDEKDVPKLEKLAMGIAGQLNPMAAYFGGIVAQEVLKACSGKFSPLKQWLHFAAPECLSSEETSKFADASKFPTLEELSGNTLSNENSRYAGQAAVFGWSFQEKLKNLKCFLVGAGALGCESLKNLALMGVSCGEQGQLTVTDMDGIEISNLNRQFLFRPQHVGKMKSTVAAEMTKEMNPNLNIKALEIKVAPDTEKTFNDSFWAGQDIIINALDNVIARKYVDSKCLFHCKPLLESGTLGTKSNTLPVVPGLTESYSSDPVQDDNDGEIPACTLHAYPNLIEHTLTWARDAVFEKYFNLDICEGVEFLKCCVDGNLDPKYIKELDRQPSTKLTRLRTARAVLIGPLESDHPEKLFPYSLDLSENGGMDLSKCVLMARMRFEELFVNKIKQLLFVHPIDKTVDDKGTLFWSGKRRPPTIEYFQKDDPLHVLFLTSAAYLYAQIYNVSPGFPDDRSAWPGVVLSILDALPPLPEFHVDGDVVVPENDEQAKEMKKQAEKKAEEEAANSSEKCEKELERMNGTIISGLNPQLFEKDDDSNGHMDLIYAAANIRARQYSIPVVDKLKSKGIVGRIIPAIATTTAMTTGAIALELYKLLHGHPIELFRSTNVNLAVNSFASFEPTPCVTKYFGKKKYVKAQDAEKILPVNIWTMVTLSGDQTVQDIVDYFLETYEFEVTTISTSGDISLYNDMFGQEDRLEQTISELFRSVTGSEPPTYIILNLDGDYDEDDDDDDDDEDEDDFVIPSCRIHWKAA